MLISSLTYTLPISMNRDPSNRLNHLGVGVCVGVCCLLFKGFLISILGKTVHASATVKVNLGRY